MAKLSRSTNYKLSEVRRLLAHVKHYLPLGKDEWERLANSYNANRGRGVAERDHESLRQKFKVLYSARKPTGVADMPPHVQLAKQLKQAIDDKTSVLDMDDGADVDEEEEEYQQHFSFDFEGEEGLEDNTHEDADADTGRSTTTTSDSMHSGETPTSVGDSVGNADLSAPLDAAGVCEGLEAFATPRPPPPSAQSTQRKLRSSSAKKIGQGPTAAAAAAAAGASTTAASAAKAKAASQQSAKGHAPSKKESKSKGYATSSSRLGGIDLSDFRDTVGRKRVLEDDEELSEASFAKAKRVKAASATAELKKRLTDLESSASKMGGSMFEMKLLMREKSERKAEQRRAEEEQEQRRRDELVAREARYLADKAEAEKRSRHERLEVEERRRQEKQEAEECARRDKEDARARTQELLLILGALTKKD